MDFMNGLSICIHSANEETNVTLSYGTSVINCSKSFTNTNEFLLEDDLMSIIEMSMLQNTQVLCDSVLFVYVYCDEQAW